MEKRNYIKEFIEALSVENGFEFLCHMGDCIEKNDLLLLLREISYAIEEADLLPCEFTEIIKTMEDNLQDELE